MIVNTFFLQHIQICTSSPAHINVFQWNRECFFFRHIGLNSWFNVMTMDEVTLKRPEVSPGFGVIFWFCRLRPFRFALKFSTETFAPCRLFPPWSGFSEFVVSSWQFCCTICYREKYSLVCGVNTSFAVILGGWISDASMFSNSSMSATSISPLQNNHRDWCISDEYSCQNCLAELVKPCLVSCRNRIIFNHCTKRKFSTFKWFSESPFIRSFPICQEVLDISHIAIAFHRISPPCFT